jgi:hypothetical protein
MMKINQTKILKNWAYMLTSLYFLRVYPTAIGLTEGGSMKI